MLKKYKPKVHKKASQCRKDCELDCDMQCDICRNTPFDTDCYYVVDPQSSSAHGLQLCSQCFKKLSSDIKRMKK